MKFLCYFFLSQRDFCLNPIDQETPSMTNSVVCTQKSDDVTLQNDVRGGGSSYGAVWSRSPSIYAFKNTAATTTRKSSRDSGRSRDLSGAPDDHSASWCDCHVVQEQEREQIVDHRQQQDKNHFYEIPECRQTMTPLQPYSPPPLQPTRLLTQQVIESILGYSDFGGDIRA